MPPKPLDLGNPELRAAYQCGWDEGFEKGLAAGQRLESAFSNITDSEAPSLAPGAPDFAQRHAAGVALLNAWIAKQAAQ